MKLSSVLTFYTTTLSAVAASSLRGGGGDHEDSRQLMGSFPREGESFFIIDPQTDKVVSVDPSGNCASGTNVIVDTFSLESEAQLFRFGSEESIESVHCPGKVIDIEGGNCGSGANILLWPHYKTHNQMWGFYSITPGTISFINPTCDKELAPDGSNLVIDNRKTWKIASFASLTQAPTSNQPTEAPTTSPRPSLGPTPAPTPAPTPGPSPGPTQAPTPTPTPPEVFRLLVGDNSYDNLCLNARSDHASLGSCDGEGSRFRLDDQGRLVSLQSGRCFHWDPPRGFFGNPSAAIGSFVDCAETTRTWRWESFGTENTRLVSTDVGGRCVTVLGVAEFVGSSTLCSNNVQSTWDVLPA